MHFWWFTSCVFLSHDYAHFREEKPSVARHVPPIKVQITEALSKGQTIMFHDINVLSNYTLGPKRDRSNQTEQKIKGTKKQRNRSSKCKEKLCLKTILCLSINFLNEEVYMILKWQEDHNLSATALERYS